MRHRIAIACAAAALVFVATDARADSETARKHFDAGRKLRDQGDCAHAIAEFDRSLAAERSIGAYYNLGYCHEQLSRRQEAHEAYKNAQQLASTRKDDRLREISGALAALLETPHIRLVLPQPLPEGIEIRVDGELVPARFHSAETVVFTTGAKSHSVVVTAPGYEERRELVAIKEVRPIELRPASAREVSTPAPPPAVPPSKADDGGLTWQHWTGLGVGAVGVGLFTVGSVMFISYRIDEASYAERHDQADACEKLVPGTDPCKDPELDARRKTAKAEYNAIERDGRDRAPIMAGTAIAGALMIGGGILLYLTAPKSTPAEPRRGLSIVPILGAGLRGAAVSGSF